MNLLSFYTPSHWRKAKGGISSYLKKIQDLLQDNIKLNTAVVGVEKHPNHVCVTLADQSQHVFDEVIFACQAYIANRLIQNGNQRQYESLKAFQYVDVQSTLHTDSAVVANVSSGDEYFQFELNDNPHASYAGSLTRVNRNLYPYQNVPETLYVSFDNRHNIAEGNVLAKKDWKLPLLRPADMQRKMRICDIQGLDNMWFCGTDYSLTGHEGALVSGLVIAHRLGADYPFADHWLAQAQFDVIKNFMGVFFTREKMLNKLSGVILYLAKKLNLYKLFSGKLIKEILF